MKRLEIHKSATFSPCRKYRYTLWRYWGSVDSEYVVFIGLNPSIADETVDDPTVRRCIGYARSWGFGGLCMVNLFAFRATLPRNMRVAEDPVGPHNDYRLMNAVKSAGVIVAVWGIHGAYMNRDEKVKEMISNLTYLKLTKKGFPGHPLYLPKTLKPILWKTQEGI